MKTPPITRLSHPSLMYPGLALKCAQTKEGITPTNKVISASSISIDFLFGEILGSRGARGLGSFSLLTKRTKSGLFEFLFMNTDLGLPPNQPLHATAIQSSSSHGRPSQIFPQ